MTLNLTLTGDLRMKGNLILADNLTGNLRLAGSLDNQLPRTNGKIQPSKPAF